MAAHTARVAFCTERAAEEASIAGNDLYSRTQIAGMSTDQIQYQWVLPDGDAGADDEHLLHGATSYLSMLHDGARCGAYESALRATLAERPAASLVLDLGAGTGLLSMLACRANRGAHAVACEAYHACAQLAEQVVERNGLSDRIHVVNKIASDLELGSDLKKRADVCVFELFDSQLLGESVLPILRDAHARLLEPNAALVPRRATVFAALVECPAFVPADLPELRGAAWPVMLGQLQLFEGGPVVRLLSTPWRAMSIDFADLPTGGPTVSTTAIELTASGLAHAVAWWWELDMGNGNSLSSWTSAQKPSDQQAARHHWRPCLSFLAHRQVSPNSNVSVSAVHDDDAVWFAWPCVDRSVPQRWLEGVTTVPPERERLLIASSSNFINALEHAAKTLGQDSLRQNRGEVLLLPAEDSLVLKRLACAVQVAGKCSVAAMLPPRTAKRLRASGEQPNDLRLTTLEAEEESASRFVAVLVEPFAPGVTSPWALILYCQQRVREISSVLFEHAGIQPAVACIRAALVECRSVWLARRPLSRVCGLDLTIANKAFVPKRAGPLECQLCELGWRPLSHAVRLVHFELAEDAARLEQGGAGVWQGSCDFTAIASGECHGVALWAEFDFGGSAPFLSTGPPAPGEAPSGWQQALQLLEEPFSVQSGTLAGRAHMNVSAAGAACVMVEPPALPPVVVPPAPLPGTGGEDIGLSSKRLRTMGQMDTTGLSK